MTYVNFEKVQQILENKLCFNFKSAGMTKEAALDDFPPETIALLLDYGTRKLNDRVNSLYAMPSNEATREQLVERVWAEALEGKLGERRQQSAGHVGFRNYILAYLRAHGAKAAYLEPYKGATPQAIINGVYASKSPEQREAILAEFNRRYEASLQAVDELQIEFD